jgi:hypothetical protein
MHLLVSILLIMVSMVFMVYCLCVGACFGPVHPNDTDERKWIVVGVMLGFLMGVLGTLVFALPAT